jgi:predicted DNA binding CopG/RHH family protein
MHDGVDGQRATARSRLKCIKTSLTGFSFWNARRGGCYEGKISKEKKVTDEEYYDKRGILDEIVEGEVALSLEDALRQDILSGKRKRKLRNITIKLDPLYLLSIKKVATKKGIPYQTLVRQWVAEGKMLILVEI